MTTKRIKLNYLMLLMMALITSTAIAHDFEVDGIYYKKNSDNTTVTVTYRGSSAIAYSNEYKGDVNIPETVTYGGMTYSVIKIGTYAFDNCDELTSVTIPNSVKTIDDGAFRFCDGLTCVNVGSSVTEIGLSAFNGCTGLTSVNINDIATWCRISFMSDDANPLFCAHHLYLNGSEVIDLVIPSSVTSIGFAVFTNLTDLNSVTIPSSVTSIGNSAFRGCTGLTSVNIPNSVTSIGYNAFNECCSLRSIAIPYSVTSIGQFAFLGCSGLNSITVEDGNSTYDSRDNCNAIIETASNVLINGCHNTIIPNSVTTIERYAFANCDALTNIAIPNSVTSIGQNAFFGCI